MKLGYTVWTWQLEEYLPGGPTPTGKIHFEEAMRSIAYLGYKCIENFNFIVPMFENNPQELVDMLKKYQEQLNFMFQQPHTEEDAEWIAAEHLWAEKLLERIYLN